MPGRKERRRGFTLVETLVVVAIVGLLVALILPAVQSAREASRRADCASRLKQVGIGLAHFHAANGRYPAGVLPDGRTRNGMVFAAPSPFSVQAQLLPYLEQGASYNSINMVRSATLGPVAFPSAVRPENTTGLSSAVAAFLCPSDPSQLAPGCNYRATVGALPYLHDGSPWPAGGGVFPGLSFVADRDITDGLSMTVGFSERLRGYGPGSGFNRARDVWFSGLETIRLATSSDDMASVCASLTTPPAEFWPSEGENWIVGDFLGTLYNHVSPPNWSAPDCAANSLSSISPLIGGGAISARSAHPGGVQALMMDGSVRFVSQGVQISVWRAAATRAGQEAIGEGL